MHCGLAGVARNSCRSLPGRDSPRKETVEPAARHGVRTRKRQVDGRHDCQDNAPACVPSTVWGTASRRNSQVGLGAVLALETEQALSRHPPRVSPSQPQRARPPANGTHSSTKSSRKPPLRQPRSVERCPSLKASTRRLNADSRRRRHVSSGAEIVHMLNDVFETLTAALRPRGGHVLKFIGDAMLATISFDEPDEKVACRRALDAAVEASSNLKARNLEREAAGLPFADVDIALHVGEVLYGNVGAADRLVFTVIGPAVNEVVRIEKLCERLNRQILFSSRFAEAAGLWSI